MRPWRDITVYTVPDCAGCEAVKWLLTSQGAPFTEKNVREDPAALAEMQVTANVRIVPVTGIDGHPFYGMFDDQRLSIVAALTSA